MNRDVMTISRLIEETQHRLTRGKVVSGPAEARILVAEAFRESLGHPLPLPDLTLKSGDAVPTGAVEKVRDQVIRRVGGEPLQYLIGWQVFLGHEYRVGPGVLVPRPETEGLVDCAMKSLAQSASPPRSGIEIGVGSGVISIELLKHFPELRMRASDASPQALEYAKINAHALLGSDAARLELLKADAKEIWPAFVAGKVDFIISNPPYLGGEDECSKDVIRHEPQMALFPNRTVGGDADRFYREIALRAAERLNPEGFVFLEIPHTRVASITAFFAPKVWKTEIISDLSQRPRILKAQLWTG